jgi:hypothetical protein
VDGRLAVNPAVGIDVLTAGLKVRALLWPLEQYANQAAALVEEHPELLPELEAANTHIAAAAEAVGRATDYLSAKLSVATTKGGRT